MKGLIRVADAPAVAAAAAELIARLIAAALAERGVAHLALAGGTTPRLTYEQLELESWAGVELWFGDERCVEPTDPESNFRMVEESLLPHASGALVHRIEGELGPDGAADAYERLVRERVAPDPGESGGGGGGGGGGGSDGGSDGGSGGRGVGGGGSRGVGGDGSRGVGGDGSVPVFDVNLLGIGPDGHTASLFPGNLALSVTGRAVVGVRDAPKPPAERVSLTLEVLCAARDTILLAAGESKAAAAAGVLAGPATGTPSSMLARDRLTLIVDAEAYADAATAAAGSGGTSAADAAP